MTDSFDILINPVENGFTFTYKQENLEKPISCAGTRDLLTVKGKAIAEKTRNSIESNALWFDEDDHLIIASPLYFLFSLEQAGYDWLISHVENWSIFWSMDPYFHLKNSSLKEADPVNEYLKSIGIKNENLPEGDYDNWEELEEQHFLQEDTVKKLTNHLLSGSGKKQLAGLYFAFNSPHIIAGLAWVHGYFRNNADFVSYTLLAEKFNGKDKEKQAEMEYRKEQLEEISNYLKN